LREHQTSFDLAEQRTVKKIKITASMILDDAIPEFSWYLLTHKFARSQDSSAPLLGRRSFDLPNKIMTIKSSALIRSKSSAGGSDEELDIAGCSSQFLACWSLCSFSASHEQIIEGEPGSSKGDKESK